MKRWMPVGIAAAALLCAPLSYAEPVVPQPDTPCPSNFEGALTRSADSTLLECAGGTQMGYRWRVLDEEYPHSDRWVTFGPTLTLAGEGQRNREVESGDWTGYPQGEAQRCTARQVAIAATGGSAPPVVATGAAGAPLPLRLEPLLLSVELGGHCLWQRG